jgi:hypothetical protein
MVRIRGSGGQLDCIHPKLIGRASARLERGELFLGVLSGERMEWILDRRAQGPESIVRSGFTLH